MELNKKRILITEGEFDKDFLELVLPEKVLKESLIVVGQGYSSAISKAKSILLRRNIPVYLIMDSDTTDLYAINEKEERIKFIFSSLGKMDYLNIFFFVPELEVVFIQDKELNKKYFNFNTSQLLDVYSPREIINRTVGNRRKLLSEVKSNASRFSTNKYVKELISLLEK